MALLEPLSLYLPTHPEKTVIKAYNTYSKAERKRIMTQNPSSFLHILGAGKTMLNPHWPFVRPIKKYCRVPPISNTLQAIGCTKLRHPTVHIPDS